MSTTSPIPFSSACTKKKQTPHLLIQPLSYAFEWIPLSPPPLFIKHRSSREIRVNILQLLNPQTQHHRHHSSLLRRRLSRQQPLSQQEQDDQLTSSQQVDPRRPEEKFAVLNTGIYECRSCGYMYDESAGDPSDPIPPGLQFSKPPDDWRCPTCGAAQTFFESKSVEMAGFAQNQQFGLGGNTLTSGQKALLVYGSLFIFFVLFLFGYFWQ